ncbi:MAG TPA: helix-turn-helix transcriptional regulator [Steroidobacteraceae bacterium]|jgi:predicted XRE-type DNA-binding protein
MAAKKSSTRAAAKKPARVDDETVTPSSGNIFVDLGFDAAEAKVMAMRAEVMIRIELRLKEQGWTQTEAAKRLGITQPRVSQLKKGAWQEFSLDTLLKLADRAGLKPQLRMGA